ncbi:ATP-binding cassette domain-containing protein [Brevundimonas sp.]|uniref:ATP-binding cassette domain-containing protein n=1 Tax=Brevundimonas sp. TaxID=1871086 RepID=UPI002D534A89|nr:ATP-binding cassette domain-containing protein [Brevundimonas sp.]HYC68891.1 ATP-binding cassette domain-containing protein [Brevundimonas sp.]
MTKPVVSEDKTLGFVVRSTTPRGAIKRVSLTARDGSTVQIDLHRFAMVGPGDVIEMRQGVERLIACRVESGAKSIVLTPAFETVETIDFAGDKVEARVSEITTTAEMADFAYLEGFHYRGTNLSGGPGAPKEKKRLGGRRAVLVLQLRLGSDWRTIGYIELQMPLMMAKPRHRAFSSQFDHPTLDVSWETWRKGGQSLVNRIARIARVVVHPEYRGAALAGPLVRNAIRFARDRWHIAGQKCLFLEISAEMLKHIDFVSSSGFTYLGETEGNRARLAKDLTSMENGASGVSGIMSLQRKYHGIFNKYRAASGEDPVSLIAKIGDVVKSDDSWASMDVSEWLALRPIVRSPIPYYMIGLDDYSNAYVKKARVDLPNRARSKRDVARVDLQVRALEVWSNYQVPITPQTRMIMDGFGIVDDTVSLKLIGPIDFSAAPGSVTFVAGASGCGKSMLLSALDPSWRQDTAKMTGEVSPTDYRAGWLRPLPEDLPIFEVLAERFGPERTFHALARVGLSEALLFLKPYWMLSRGQRYRAMLANLMLQDDPVWLIDEFCSDLDPISARIVAQRLHETVKKEGRIAIVAAANHGHFLQALKPSQVIYLSTSGSGTRRTWREQLDAV